MLELAQERAQKAVWSDLNGDFKDALTCYEQTLDFLMLAMNSTS